MPKRLCAVALTTSQTTILAGDKFGDVYALPLHHSFNSITGTPSKPEVVIPKPHKPSASELTVHTKGNLEALRQQQLNRVFVPRKQLPIFEHQLVLGHVSVLTDLVVGVDVSNAYREYILTADRDEHIRVSRGIPQAHVINNYCLGHTDFVSRLCTIPELPQFLISGGGEPSIRIYDWLRGETVAEASLEENLKDVIKDIAYSRLQNNNHDRAVSCVRALYTEGSSDREEAILIMVNLEG
jgi:tRNA (guanine-N(7)-)-methyltransferase subunit TRM82